MTHRTSPLSHAAVAGTLAGLLALAGCMNLTPEYRRPAAPVPSSYAPDWSASAPVGEPPAGELDWQQFFTDARLRRLVEIAIQNNRDLRVAVLNIEQARAMYQVKRADELPTIGAGLTAQREPGVTGAPVSSVALGVQLSSYELDLFGRVRSLSSVALAQYLSTEQARRAAQIALVAAVATVHVSMLADDELLRVTDQALKTRADSLDLTRLKFDHGAASELDFRQAEQLLEGARVALAQARRQRAQDENALVLLLGQALPSDLPAAQGLGRGQGAVDVPAGLPSDLLTRRPDVLAAEQQLVAANANIGAARAAFFPRITLTGTAGTASTQLSGLFRSGSFAWTGVASLVQPIFDAGRNQANLQVAVVGRDIALAQYEKSIQTAFREVSDALAARVTLDEQLRAQVAQTRAAQTAYTLSDLRYRNGAASYLEVLDAQRSLFLAQLATVQVQAQQVQNGVLLYKALGGGWTAPTSTN